MRSRHSLSPRAPRCRGTFPFTTVRAPGVFRRPRQATLAMLVLLLSAVGAEAQITLGRTAKGEKAKVEVDAASRILVATPFLEGRDASEAVKVCNAVRDRLITHLGSKYTVVPRSHMNTALKHFGYKDDEVLPEAVFPDLAARVEAGITIVTMLAPTGDGRYAAKAEVRGLGTPVEVSVTQVDGEPLEAVGVAVADLIAADLIKLINPKS